MCAQSENFLRKNDADQRYFPRWVVAAPILYKHQNTAELKNGQTKDLSCCGACVSIDEILPLNDKIKLTIHLSPAENIEVFGRVVWQQASIDGNRAGISFYNTSDAVQNRILQHAFEIDREEITKHWFSGWEDREYCVG
jgi:c-di-GMP-binding flagellar brake protein YcgR